jgi:hypothetical protein
MRVRVATGILLVALSGFAADRLLRLNVKTGLWEVTKTIRNVGHMPIPAGMLERLTPEQRARMEARLKAQPAERSRTITEKECVTEQDMHKGDLFTTNPNRECTEHLVNATSTDAVIQLACREEGLQGNGMVKIKVLNPESVEGSSHITATGNGRTLNTDSTFTAKWVSATCGKTH